MDSLATLDEIKSRLKMILTPLPHTRLDYTVTEPNPSQFKIFGIYSRDTDKASFTIDLIPGTTKLFVARDLQFLFHKIIHNFQHFTTTNFQYSSPFEYYTTQTIFYNLVQIYFRSTDTVLPPSPPPFPAPAHTSQPTLAHLLQSKYPPTRPRLPRPSPYMPRTHFLPPVSHLPLNLQRPQLPLQRDTSPPVQDIIEV